MLPLHVSLLGGFSLLLADSSITLNSRKAEALVAYLAFGQRPFARDELAQFFWPESDPAQATANLRKLLSELRRPLAPYLLIDRQSVALTLYNLDTTTFNQLAAAVDREDGLATAVALYQGDFLAGLYLRDSLPFDEWATLERERHQQTMLTALRRLTTHHLHQGQYEQALRCVARWLALDPLAEAAHRLAMRLHARRGRRNAALAQFSQCQRILEEELGVSPTAETVRLYYKIRETPPPPTDPVPGFVGREKELSEISRLLDDPVGRLLTLTGPGGIGKTRLARQAAARCAADFRHGVCLVALDNLDLTTAPSDALLSLLATTLNLPFNDKQLLQKQLLHYLRQKEMLLLFDNFESLLAAAPLLQSLLDEAPQVQCLVTSRQPLQLPGETTLRLDGLPYPSEPPEQPEQYAALAFFAASARQVAPDFRLDAATLPPVIQICRLVDGLPLALELAARAARAFSPAQIADQLQDDLDFLASRARDLPPRHRSLRLVFDYTWDLLAAAEQAAFARLCLLPGPFAADAARAITGVTAVTLHQLTDKAILQAATANQYQIHDLLRRYGQEKLVQNPAAAAATAAAHAHYYANLLHRLQADLENARQPEALQTIRQNLPHLRYAWRWGIAQGDVALLSQIVLPTCRFCAISGLYQEAADLLAHAIAELETAVTPDARLLHLRCLIQHGAFLCGLGQYETAGQTLAVALTEAQALSARPEAAAGYREQGNLALVRGQLDQAERDLDQSLQLYQAEEDEPGEADVWHRLGQTYIQLSQPEQAQRAFNHSLAICRRLGRPQGVALALSGLALVTHYWTGAYTEAEPLYLEALALKRELGHRHGMANDLNNLGNLACNLQAFERAIAYYEESLAIKRDVGLPLGIAITLSNLGTAYQELGQYGQAAALYEESLGISQTLGDQVGVLFCLANLAELAHVQEQYAVAEQRWRRVLQLSLAAQTPDRLHYCLTGLACLWADPAAPAGQPTQAAVMFYYVLTHPGCNQGVRDKITPPLAHLEATLTEEALTAARAQAAVWHEEDITEQVRSLLKTAVE
ncbi:MAG: tetratricopeptide repeat protein [Anaerolinea sp.]|nr:tetratricopeptide repeat protein [Anaerolinea sp.]